MLGLFEIDILSIFVGRGLGLLLLAGRVMIVAVLRSNVPTLSSATDQREQAMDAQSPRAYVCVPYLLICSCERCATGKAGMHAVASFQ